MTRRNPVRTVARFVVKGTKLAVFCAGGFFITNKAIDAWENHENV